MGATLHLQPIYSRKYFEKCLHMVVRSPVSGATFFIWRDFFIWRVFYAGAWVTLCIPYYSVMNIVSNNHINCCIPLYTLKRG